MNYKKAIELDPDYSLAYAGLADLYIFNQKGLTQLEAVPIARDYANKALSLDSTLTEALTTMGFIQCLFDYDWKKAKATLEKAIKFNPGYAYAHVFYGNLLQFAGENTEKGIEEIKKARELDPSSVPINWALGRNYYYAGKYDLAQEELKKVIKINFVYSAVYSLAKVYLAFVFLAEKKYDSAIEIIRQIPEKGIVTNGVYQGTMLSYAYAVSGNISQARAELKKTLHENSYNTHYLIAIDYMGLNDYDLAVRELEKAIAEREIYLYFLKVDPIFNPIRNQPAFKELLKKTGFE